jgi:hypothetical protein
MIKPNGPLVDTIIGTYGGASQSTAACTFANSGLRQLSWHGNGSNAGSLSKQRSIPRNANSWQIGFSKGLGNTQHLVFSIVSSLSTMSRSSPYVQT